MSSGPDAKQLEAAFDHASEAQMRNPYPMYEQFRARCPVGRSAQHGGFYFVATHAGAKSVMDDYSTFSSTSGVGIPPHPYKMFPIDLDPPQQTKFRRILNPRFAPEAVTAHRAKIEAEVHRLIDGFIERGEAELAADLVRPLLPAIVLPLLGVPSEEQARMSAWIEYLTRGRATDLAGVAKAGEEIGSYLMTLVAQRRQQPAKDDIIGLLLESRVDSQPLGDEDIFRTVLIILFGGLDTTSAVMLESLRFLADHPGEKTKLANGERDWQIAVEEFVRFTSPIQGLRRTVTKETELEGQPLKPGDWVMALHGSANRDAALFASAEQCLLDRRPNLHLAFGAGAHICLGRNLARLEIEILLRAALKRFPDWQTDAGFEPEYLAGEARGMKTLPVRFTPGVRYSS